MKNKRIVKLSSLLVTVVILLCCMAPAVFAQNGESSDTASTAQAAQSDTANATASGAGWVQMAPMNVARLAFETAVVNGKIYAIGGTGNEGSTVEEYDPATNTWTLKAPMLIPRGCAFQAEVINNKIYVLGGVSSSSQGLSSVEEYDPITDIWSEKAPMKPGRNGFQAKVIDGKIYVIGGISDDCSSINSVEEYDPNLNTWTNKASMVKLRDDLQAEVINGRIYAVSGNAYPASGNYNTVEEYNIDKDTWVTKESTAEQRLFFQTSVIDNNIYAVGGMQKQSPQATLSSVEEYQVNTGKWTNKASMSSPRRDLQTVVVKDKIYAIGGKNSADFLSSMEVYDVATDKWTTKEPMHTGRSDFQAVALNGTIYAIGGRSDTGYLSSVEAYTVEQPSLTVTPSADKVKLNSQFTTTVAIHNGTNICAEDMKLTYDTNLFEYVGSESLTGLTVCTEDKATPGALRFVVASQGIENAATGDKDLIKLTFKAKAPGTGKVDITQGRIADNVSLETDVAEANCGEATVTVETSKDMNRSGEVTLLDLGIDAGYYGKKAADTDAAKYDTDAVPDGVIDGKDLDAITVDMLANAEYPMNK